MATRIKTKEWTENSIGEICRFVYGKNLSEKDRISGDVPVYGSNGIVGFHDRALVPSAGIVIGRKGSVGEVHFSETPFYPIDTTFYISQKDTKTDIKFLFYLLKEANLKKLKADVGVPGINREMAYREPVLIPKNIEEQKSIARVLTTMQDAIAEQEKLIAKLKELKRSMMHHLFTKGTKGEKTKMTEIGEIPESWDVAELIDVCDKPQYGFTDSASSNGNVRFLRITDITDEGVNWDKVPFCNCAQPEKYLLQDGDIVFARIGATTGKSFLLRNPDNAVYASYLIRVRAKTIDSSFLYHYFQTEAYWRQIDSQKGTNLKGGVNGSILSKLIVPKCDRTEQKRIAESLNAIDARVESTRVKLASYQSLFKTLLHELMSGERRVVNI